MLVLGAPSCETCLLEIVRYHPRRSQGIKPDETVDQVDQKHQETAQLRRRWHPAILRRCRAHRSRSVRVVVSLPLDVISQKLSLETRWVNSAFGKLSETSIGAAEEATKFGMKHAMYGGGDL